LPAWNSHDIDSVPATITADASFADTGWRRTFHGPDQWRIPIGQLWSAFPDLRFESLTPPMLVHGRMQAGFHYRGTGTMTGPLGRHSPTGRAFSFEAIEVLGFRDGLVCSWWGVTDTLDLYRRIGVKP
jgi:predicted ester cyclase